MGFRHPGLMLLRFVSMLWSVTSPVRKPMMSPLKMEGMRSLRKCVRIKRIPCLRIALTQIIPDYPMSLSWQHRNLSRMLLAAANLSLIPISSSAACNEDSVSVSFRTCPRRVWTNLQRCKQGIRDEWSVAPKHQQVRINGVHC